VTSKSTIAIMTFGQAFRPHCPRHASSSDEENGAREENRPLTAIPTAGPQHVLKQMHMETQEDRQARFPFLRGKREHKRRNDQREHQVVKRVLIKRKSQQGMRRVSSKQFWSNTETVDIRSHTGERDQGAVSLL
jgi:hypothetical protein